MKLEDVKSLAMGLIAIKLQRLESHLLSTLKPKHIYYGILLSHKKEWINAICSDTDGPRAHHTEWSKVDRERQISYDIAYMWYLKKMVQRKLFIKWK